MCPKPADIGREPRKYPVFGMTIVQYRSGQGCFPETFSAGFHFSWCESDTIRDPNPGNGPQSGKMDYWHAELQLGMREQSGKIAQVLGRVVSDLIPFWTGGNIVCLVPRSRSPRPRFLWARECGRWT